ncbi:hypothetical protein BJN34_34555 [Cupriavidus necator]|uniref:Uncharacterized protein n=1 Tax=Cupriavidus necator TaxID=106590 RepID=A0A1U9V279_CUPNE|nr:hypothetical protein BJN34_34555 [Cupriavidus necator]
MRFAMMECTDDRSGLGLGQRIEVGRHGQRCHGRNGGLKRMAVDRDALGLTLGRRAPVARIDYSFRKKFF